jgi:hypothetical protein
MDRNPPTGLITPPSVVQSDIDGLFRLDVENDDPAVRFRPPSLAPSRL